LGPQVQAKGDVQTDDDIFVDCSFEGKLTTPGALEIGKNAAFKGTVAARSVIVEGEVNAQIKADEEISVANCASVKGSLEALRVSADHGAALDAKIKTGGGA
jgi:cytoskeletal protein CcmA (bactofilin family)